MLARSSLAMARRRERGWRPWLCAAVNGVVITAGLAALILLSNEVTRLRTEIAALEEQRANLVARQALLAAHWNDVSSQRVVMARASEELGLVSRPDPGQVLVLNAPQHAQDDDLWRRVIAAVGAGESVPAAAAAGARP